MNKLQVLVIDDEPAMRMEVERSLNGERLAFCGNDEFEIVVDSASTGSEGIDKVAKGKTDVLFLAYRLPDMNGLDVIEKLGKHSRSMAIIMITAYASIEVAVEATRKGVSEFLRKPLSPAELLAATRKAMECLRLSQKRAQLAQERKQIRFEFIKVLGHELKAPLNAVEGYLDLMQSTVLGDELEPYQQYIGRSMLRLQQMRKLIVDLLDMTRLESGQKIRKLTAVDLRQIAETAIELVSQDAEQRQIKIELQAPEQLLVTADAGEMEIMLNNLISNAVKYNRDGGMVSVGLYSEEDNIIIKVADTGIGMTAEEQTKLFQEFSRIKNTKTANILGSGLGLSILKRLAELYGGNISVESEYGKGSTFTLNMPECHLCHKKTGNVLVDATATKA